MVASADGFVDVWMSGAQPAFVESSPEDGELEAHRRQLLTSSEALPPSFLRGSVPPLHHPGSAVQSGVILPSVQVMNHHGVNPATKTAENGS